MTHSLEGKFRGQARWPHSRRRRRRRSRRRHRRRRRSKLDIFPSQTRGRSVACHQTNDITHPAFIYLSHSTFIFFHCLVYLPLSFVSLSLT